MYLTRSTVAAKAPRCSPSAVVPCWILAHIALTSLGEVAIERSRPDRAKTQECTTRPSVELCDVRPLGTVLRADSHA